MQLILGDCLEVMRGMEPNSIDSIVTDPPYGFSFMNKDWDYGIPNHRYWGEAYRIAKPGCHLLAFGGTRTFHRLTCAIEDSGWQIRDCLMWVYGSGFPKSHNLKGDVEGWGTALKPAWEPIILARKPLEGTVAVNAQKWGCGALNIDGSRVAHSEPIKPMKAQAHGDLVYGQSGRHWPTTELKPSGRWPANLIHDGSEEVMELFPNSKSTNTPRVNNRPLSNAFGKYSPDVTYGFSDSGSAARFFYCAKASRKERGEDNKHPTVKPLALMRYLCRLVTPPDGVVLDPFMGSGTTGIAAKQEGFDFIGIEQNQEYLEIAKKRINGILFAGDILIGD
jgi:site-specific DNA-methyltransferase (adenine-specific)